MASGAATHGDLRTRRMNIIDRLTSFYTKSCKRGYDNIIIKESGMGNSLRQYLNRILNNFTTRFRIYAKRAVGVGHFYMLECSQKHISELVLNKLAIFRLAAYHKPTCSTRKHTVGNTKTKEVNKLLRLLASYLTGCNIFFVEFYKVSVWSAKSVEPKKI